MYRFHVHHRNLADWASVVSSTEKSCIAGFMDQVTAWRYVGRNPRSVNIFHAYWAVCPRHFLHTLKMAIDM